MFIPSFRTLLLTLALALPMSAQATLHIFVASLDAAQEVQTPAVVSPAVGTATLAFNDVTDMFNLTLAGVGLTTPIQAAHFHKGAFGANGSIVRDLDPATIATSFVQAGGAFNAIYLNTPAGGLLLADLLAGNIYVNVHTTGYPGGEIRGQLGQLAPIPEPGTWILLTAGLVLLAGSALRRWA